MGCRQLLFLHIENVPLNNVFLIGPGRNKTSVKATQGSKSVVLPAGATGLFSSGLTLGGDKTIEELQG